MDRATWKDILQIRYDSFQVNHKGQPAGGSLKSRLYSAILLMTHNSIRPMQLCSSWHSLWQSLSVSLYMAFYKGHLCLPSGGRSRLCVLSLCGPSLCGPSLCGPSLCGPSLWGPSLWGPSLCGSSLVEPFLPGPSLFGPSLFGCPSFRPSLCRPSLFTPSLCGLSFCGPYFCGPSPRSLRTSGGLFFYGPSLFLPVTIWIILLQVVLLIAALSGLPSLQGPSRYGHPSGGSPNRDC
jgi:hypothetical protein